MTGMSFLCNCVMWRGGFRSQINPMAFLSPKQTRVRQDAVPIRSEMIMAPYSQEYTDRNTAIGLLQEPVGSAGLSMGFY